MRCVYEALKGFTEETDEVGLLSVGGIEGNEQ